MKRSLLLLSVSAICLAQPATADPASIINGTDWKDTAGNPIAAHEGELSRFNGVFYWYGSSYANNPTGKFDIADGPVWNGVHRPPENCQSTDFGLKRIEAWLGDGSWDVIHFNWGIWDAHYLNGGKIRTSPKDYEQNLQKLVLRLKATGAKLIWASTTPVKDLQQNGISVKGADIPVRNAIARKVMEENGIPINDLHQKMLPHVDQLRGADGCHYTPEGSAFLAKHVAESVEKALKTAEVGAPK